MNFLCLFRFNHEDIYVLFTEVSLRLLEDIRVRRNFTNDEIFMWCMKNQLFPRHNRPFVLISSHKVSNQFVEELGDEYHQITISEEYLP